MQTDYQILDEKKALSQEMLMLCARLYQKLDVQPNCVGVFWINCVDYRGIRNYRGIRMDEMKLARYSSQRRVF
jgi:hypothetical protein